MCKEVNLFKQVFLGKGQGKSLVTKTEWVPIQFAVVQKKLQFVKHDGTWSEPWTVYAIVNNVQVTDYVKEA